MDTSTVGLGGEYDLGDSWTLIDKESIEPADAVTSSVDNESKEKDTSPTSANEDQSTCSLCDPGEGLDSALPETMVKSNNEATESIDSDGISIISESEEEEELQLLPCHPPVALDNRSDSRSSNKYFDETDTSSQCSSRAQDFVGVESEKKYVHQPNSGLNTSLNVLLVISCAAVLGLGMGHFLGLQEECSTGYVVEDKLKGDSVSNEDLSAVMLKKLELENKALKEQFANLQMVIEEIRRNSTVESCKDKSLPERNADSSVVNSEDEVLDDKIGARCVLSIDSQGREDIGEDDVPQQDPDPVVNYDSGQVEDAPSGESHVVPKGVMIGKEEIFPRLEESLENIASLFIDRVNGEKLLPEGSKEALGATFSVFSTLMESLQEKLGALKKSMDEGTLSFDVPLQAISKMEEIIHKTSEKIQKVTENAIKEGKPLFSISNSVTSKLQAINKKLERKWCQIKKNMSKQSVILSWLDDQIFNNCSEEKNEEDGVNVKDDPAKGKPVEGVNGMPEKKSEERKETKYYASGTINENVNEAGDLGRKYKGIKIEENYRVKQKYYRKNENVERFKENKYNKKNNYIDPNSFDFGHVPYKGKKEEYLRASGQKMESKKGKANLREKWVGIDEMYGLTRDKEGPKDGGGEWMEALFNSRAERRRDERRSDWIFARARSRNKPREIQPSRWYLRKSETRAER